MQAFLLQDFLTIRGATSVSTITMPESQWLDLSGFQDVVMWLEVKELTFTGGTNIQMGYQTAPSKDESLFVNMTAAFNLGAGVTVTPLMKDTATNALARWVRWQLTATGVQTAQWDACFRIWIAGNAPGPRNGRALPPATRGALNGGTPMTPSIPAHVAEQPGLMYTPPPRPGVALPPSPGPSLGVGGPGSPTGRR